LREPTEAGIRESENFLNDGTNSVVTDVGCWWIESVIHHLDAARQGMARLGALSDDWAAKIEMDAEFDDIERRCGTFVTHQLGVPVGGMTKGIDHPATQGQQGQERQGMTDTSPEQQLDGMITGYWISQAIYAAAKFGIADELKDGPRSVEQLAEATSTNPDALYRLLRALGAVDLVVGQVSNLQTG
jgi:hypothetical protein